MTEEQTRTYEEMTEKMRFIIDSYASYWSPARIVKSIDENFQKSAAIKVATVIGYKMQYEELILARRKEMQIEMPIMNPADRMAMAQEIYDMAMEGVAVVIKNEIHTIPNPKVALEAVRIAHSMSVTKDGSEVMDSDIIRNVVKETFQSIKMANPEMNDIDVANLMMDSMEEDSKPYIQELHSGLNN